MVQSIVDWAGGGTILVEYRDVADEYWPEAFRLGMRSRRHDPSRA